MTGDINEIPKVVGQSIQGCATGQHEVDIQSAQWSMSDDGMKIVVKMRCAFCNNTIVREEPAGALIPGAGRGTETASAPAAPAQAPAQAPRPQPTQQPVVIVQEPLYKSAKASDDFWESLKS